MTHVLYEHRLQLVRMLSLFLCLSKFILRIHQLRGVDGEDVNHIIVLTEQHEHLMEALQFLHLV